MRFINESKNITKDEVIDNAGQALHQGEITCDKQDDQQTPVMSDSVLKGCKPRTA